MERLKLIKTGLRYTVYDLLECLRDCDRPRFLMSLNLDDSFENLETLLYHNFDVQ